LPQVLEWLSDLDARNLLIAIGVYFFIETAALIGLVMPADIVVMFAGATVQDPFAFVLVVLTVVVAQLAGESMMYGVGQLFGDRLRHGRLGRWVGERRWCAAEQLTDRRGALAVAIAHFAPVAHELVPLVAGTLGLGYRRFLLWSALGSFAWATTCAGVGVAARTSYRQLGPRITAGLLVVIAAALLAAWLAGIVRRARKGARDAKGTNSRGCGGAGAVDVEVH